MKYSLIPALFLVLAAGKSLAQQEYQVVTVGFYNVENLFTPQDEVDVIVVEDMIKGDRSSTLVLPKTPELEEKMNSQEYYSLSSSDWSEIPYDTIYRDTKDSDNTPDGDRKYDEAVYRDKLDKLSYALGQMKTDMAPDGPAIIGIAEIENRQVLEDLAEVISSETRQYGVVHYDCLYSRGVDVGFLYDSTLFTPISSQSVYVPLDRHETKDKGRVLTRDILVVEGDLLGERVHILVNHWPSRSGGQARSNRLRVGAAEVCREVVDEILANEPEAKIIIMGDLNDDPVDESVVDALGATGDRGAVVDLYNPWVDDYKNGRGTLAYGGSWNLFDQIIVSKSFIEDDTKGWMFYKEARTFDAQMLVQEGTYKGGPFRSYAWNNYIGGYSDHLPVMVYLVRPVK